MRIQKRSRSPLAQAHHSERRNRRHSRLKNPNGGDDIFVRLVHAHNRSFAPAPPPQLETKCRDTGGSSASTQMHVHARRAILAYCYKSMSAVAVRNVRGAIHSMS